MKRKLVIGLTAAAIAAMTAFPAWAGAWIQDTGRAANTNGISNWWYRNDDGTYPANGWFWLDGNKDGLAESYRFNENGWMYASTTVDNFQVDGSGAWTVNGTVQRKQVSNSAGGAGENSGTGNSSQNGTGTAKNQWIQDANGRRYYNSKGELTHGWKKISGKQYYFDDSGYALTGYQEVDGTEYYFYSDGEMATKTVHDSEEGVYYVVDKSEHYVVDVVDESEWRQYKREADSSSVDTSKVTGTDKKEDDGYSASGSSSVEEGFDEELAMECFDLINKERKKKGLDPLEFNETLFDGCRVRAEEIVESFSHTRPDGDKYYTVVDAEDLGADSDTRYHLGENIAAGQRSPAEAVKSWMSSPGHKRNILTKEYTEAAVGCYVDPDSVYGYYWVQLFYRP